MKAPKLIIMLLIFMQVSAVAGEKLNLPRSAVRLKSLSGSPKDTSAINSLIRKGTKYFSYKDAKLDIAKTCIDSAVLICERKNIEVPARLHLLLAEYHYATSDLRSASEEASIAMKKAAGSGNSEDLARINLFFGKYYRRTRFFKESIEYYENAIAISKKEGLKGFIPISYLEQADVFWAINDLSGQRKILEKLIDASFAENDSARAILGYRILGTSFCGDSATAARRNFGKADSLLRKCYALSTKRKDTLNCSWSLSNMGWNYYLEKMYDSSVFYFETSLEKYSIPGNIHSMASNSLGNLGTLYRDLKNPEKALKYYKKAIDHGLIVKSLFNLQWIYMDMSDMYLSLKDTANAYKSYILFKKYSDSNIKKENSQGLTDARIRYEVDTQKKEVELLSLRLKNNRLLNYGFAGFIFLGALIGLLIFRGSKLKDKRRISEMNRKISEITQANLRQQMNPHFIFNTLNSIQYYMYQHDKLATNNYLTKFSSLMRKVLDNSQHTSVPISDELSALNLYLELESIRFKDKFEYKINIDDEIDPLMHKIPTMLIQPYVENSICHGLIPKEGKGFVNVDLKLNCECIICTIEDNGIGREAAKERNQRRENNHNSLGTQITKSRLDLVNELYGTSLQTVYTDLKNENSEPTGTRVEIHIPIVA
ncbi:MAG: signal transduction histidine kinase, LytS [Bacteroidetes bacterium]|nr:signal transduction histidine kinase, LytS [Bacteroidota bacterium]